MKSGSGALFKGLMVALVALLVLIPVQLLSGLVEERAQLRQQAVNSVARGWGGTQLLGGPIMVIPTTVARDNGHPALIDWYVLPESLTLESELTVQDERRKLGVYEVPVYVTRVHAVARFDIAGKVTALMNGPQATTIHLDRARLLVPISDTRGVRDVKITGAALAGGAFEPDGRFVMGALATPLRADAQIDKGEQRFELTLQVAGTYSLAFLPTARSSSLQLAGNWADPGFTRGFLPVERGLALSVFYLLLLALAEHIGFTLAYVLAAIALCALLGSYLSGAFDSGRSGSGAGAVFAGVYALLYLLVTSEDYALLAGSLAVFALLATAMVLTRRLDWYQATARPRAE